MQYISKFFALNSFSNFVNFLPVLVECGCLAIKLLILFVLYRHSKSLRRNESFYYLMFMLATGAFTNITLIILRLGWPPFQIFSPTFFRGVCRIESAFLALQYYVLLCFFRDLSSQKISNVVMRWYMRCMFCFTVVSVIIFSLWGIYTFLSGNTYSSYTIKRLFDWFVGFLLVEGFISLLIAFRNYLVEPVKLLKHHIFMLGSYFMVPYLIVKIFESHLVAPMLQFSTTTMMINFPASMVTSIWLTGMIYYCTYRLVGLRFLNMNPHVQSKFSEKFSFVDGFKTLLGRLSCIATLDGIAPIIKEFFHKSFDVENDKVELFFRDSRYNKLRIREGEKTPQKLFIETIFSNKSESNDIVSYINTHKIVIRDEVEFSHLYNQAGKEREQLQAVVDFLRDIQADVFLPIYNDTKLLAYIIIRQDARPNRFYTDVERDEMLICCDYLGSVIYLLAHMNLDMLLKQQRELQEEIFKKDRTLGVFKRSLSFFLGVEKTRKIGVLIYKNKKFAYCNQIAKDLIKIDLNKDRGLECTQILAQMGHDTTVFLSSKRELISMPGGNQLVATTTPNLLKRNAVITLANPTMSDLVKDELRSLKDQTKWEYLLALKSIEEGRLLNQLIPANTPILLNCKVSFFEYVLTRKTLLFDLASGEDALAFAHIAHKIHGRKMFEEISLQRSVDDQGLAVKFFGMNPLFKMTQEKGLFEMLDGKGTLLISNVHLLSLSLQQKLLEYIISGRFAPHKSDAHVEADVLLICATSQNLQDLVQRGQFLQELYLVLQETRVWMPSLSALPEDEFLTLIEGLRKQIVQSKLYQNLLVFTERDKQKLLASGCVSFYELRTKIQTMLLKKTRRQSLDDEAIIDAACRVADLELVDAARMGRHALKDPKIFAMLMRKFKYNQTKVATFLGVNRSTISRRCTQYGIQVSLNEAEALQLRPAVKQQPHS